ncbi:hypothetical protein [Kocuria rosea]|jgi:hypothetical protein|uniref:hypothetical protein n=1 Tax=Kocuria rosea TaxID=1275 RepID=UPI00203FB266|nr:hypothetical protein [Kocuria rosea]MCM3686521.1 hypothetical protein [Kocuria rosea]HST70948.1 hypothetical protein [Kocuria rosea]
MEKLHKTLAGAALAGLIVTGGASAPAFAGDDKGDDKGGYSHNDKGRDHDRKDERNNGEVDVKVKYKDRHGKWQEKEYEDVSLKKAASIAKEKAGGKWDKYYRDAKYTDKTGKTVHTVDKYKVDVYFKQDEDKRHDHGHKDERNNDQVDVVIKYKNHHGKWEKKEYEDVSLKKAASIAKDKGDGKWDKYYRDAKYTDKTGKTVHTVDEYKVDVYFKQDNDDDKKGHGHKG